MPIEKPDTVVPSLGGSCLPGRGGDTMYDALKRHEVHVLRKAGLSLSKTAKQTEVPLATVKRILRESPVTELSAPPRTYGTGRPSLVEKFKPLIQSILREGPRLPSVEVLHRVRQQGYSGGKSALYELTRTLRPSVPQPPLVRFEGLAGEFSQHDFGQTRVTYADGSTEVIRFFASRLKWSRWSHVVFVPDETVESLLRALLLGFESFGGVPLVAVFDNPKTVVRFRHKDRIEWNSTFGQFALDFRFAPELCTPRMANQKGSVENLVGWVKGSFFKVRRFHDREDLEQQRTEWLHEVNSVRPSRATGVTPASRMEEERKRLRPLVVPPDEYALRFPVRVGPTGWVLFQGVQYSMPPGALNRPGTLFLYPQKVRIVVGPYRVEHPRRPAHGTVSTLPEHRAAGLAQVSGKRAKRYYQRQRLLELGEGAERFLTELVHARPRVWSQDVEQLFGALQGVGPERVLSAMEQAYERGLFGAEYVVERLQERTG